MLVMDETHMTQETYELHVGPGSGQATRKKLAGWFAAGGVAVWQNIALDSAGIGQHTFTRHNGEPDFRWKYEQCEIVTDPARIEVIEEQLVVGRARRYTHVVPESAWALVRDQVATFPAIDTVIGPERILHLVGGPHAAIACTSGDGGQSWIVAGSPPPTLKLYRFPDDKRDWYVSGWTRERDVFWLRPWTAQGLVDDYARKRRRRVLVEVETP